MEGIVRRADPSQVTTRNSVHSPEGPTLLGLAGWFPPGMSTSDSIIGTHGTPSRNPDLCATCHVSRFTATDKATGKFRSRQGLSAPRGMGFEYLDAKAADKIELPGGAVVYRNSYDMKADAIAAAKQAKEKLTATSVKPGKYDLMLDPSHTWLTIHESVGHPLELDRVLGYEANYAGTSFVKLSDVGKLKYGSKLMNITADRTMQGGMATIGFDDDGVKTTQFPIVRDGILVGLQTNRETAPLIGDKASKGCTSASSWRDYPFLRMPNVHLEPGPKGSPNVDQIIADTKDGVLIDGRGSYSIDQQRYNGQFGGNCFWEIKNGKITRMVTDVTYNAITTDFWANLDLIGSQETWKMFGTGGDAKGQPTQTNSISHGSPYVRIKKIMVGAAYA